MGDSNLSFSKLLARLQQMETRLTSVIEGRCHSMEHACDDRCINTGSVHGSDLACPGQLAIDAAASACTVTDAASVADPAELLADLAPHGPVHEALRRARREAVAIPEGGHRRHHLSWDARVRRNRRIRVGALGQGFGAGGRGGQVCEPVLGGDGRPHLACVPQLEAHAEDHHPPSGRVGDGVHPSDPLLAPGRIPHGSPGAPGLLRHRQRVPRTGSTAVMAQFDATLPARKPVVQTSATPDTAWAEDHVRYQQQPFSYSMQPPQVPVNGPQGIGVNAYKDSNHPAAESLREYAHDLPHDYAIAIDARMQAVHLGPIAPPESSVQGKPSIPHGVIDHAKVGKPPVNNGGSSICKSQVGGYHIGTTNAFTAPALTQEDNIARHSEQPPYVFDVGA